MAELVTRSGETGGTQTQEVEETGRGKTRSDKEKFMALIGRDAYDAIRETAQEAAEEVNLSEKVSKVMKGESVNGSGKSFGGVLATRYQANEEVVKGFAKLSDRLKGTVGMSESQKEDLSAARFTAKTADGGVYVFGLPLDGLNMDFNGNPYYNGRKKYGMDGYCIYRDPNGQVQTIFKNIKNMDQMQNAISSEGLGDVANVAHNKDGQYLEDILNRA